MRTACYARYSTDMQSASSLDDQVRNIRAYCARMGWAEPVVYQDAEISGSRGDRAEYSRLIAEADRYDVILFDDLTRFGRDNVELQQQIRRLRFRGVRVVGVSDGIDSSRNGYKLEVALRGIIGEITLDDIAAKTHRGLTGKALAGLSAGGLPYGYRVTTTGQREILDDHARVVRRIYAEYLAGLSSRQIAAALNAEGIPSPRGGEWAASAIYGDIKRGIGILANPIYAGLQVWNRSQWVKNPSTMRRVRKERPCAEWVTTQHPELAIINQPTWEAVQARLKALGRTTRAGRPNRYLLSGILRCGECGGPMVIVDRYRYGCARAKDRGTCGCTLKVPRKQAERDMLAGIKKELLSEGSFQRFRAGVEKHIRNSGPSMAKARKQAEDARQEVANLMKAIRAGIITPSTKEALQEAEAKLEAALLATNHKPLPMLPRAREVWQSVVSRLEDQRIPQVREAIIAIIGDSAVVKSDGGGSFIELAPRQISMVAGAGYMPYLTKTVRIQLGGES